MDIRVLFSALLTAIAALLIFCAVRAFRSGKTIGRSVGFLELSLIPPIVGNLIIIGSGVEVRSAVGCYIYFLGMDLVMFMLVIFTNEYCTGLGNGQQKPTIMYLLLAADTIQMLLNPFTGHAFGLEAVNVEGKAYFTVNAHFGQTVHRIVVYFEFFCVIIIFLLASVKTAKIYREKFTVILGSMIVVGIWQTFYIISKTPIDSSMIGYGVCGLLVFYFSLLYRPMRLLDRMLSNIVSEMSESLFVFDPAENCLWANDEGMKFTDIKYGEWEKVPDVLTDIFGKPKMDKHDWTDNKIISAGGSARYYTIEKHSVSADSKHLAGFYIVIRDNTEEQRRIREELYNSTHDSLTGLFTKQYLYECIRKTVDSDSRTEYAAIFVDVKNFKIVNDVFSTEFGDKALIQIADRIRQNMDSNCVYGRLAGDTFGVFIPSAKFVADKEMIAEKLDSFIVSDGDRVHHLLLHLGVYIVTDKDIDVSVMFDRAHLALTTINDDYKTHIAYYDDKLREKVLYDQKITASLREAVDTMQLRPYLQPITDNSGKIVGAEALARWIHPEQGFLPPSAFIPVFEKNGMIVEVDKHMWRCACKLLAKWKGVHDDVFISVNISPKDFYFIDVVSEIKALVKEYGIEPQKLRIEITETVMMNDAAERVRILENFRSSGFVVEMDDFGSGYSSLNMLKDMPVDVLKIDMKFLSLSGSEEKGRTIMKNIIRLSEELNITSLTEGVETEEQYDRLHSMGCKMFQGYYFAKPMSAEDFESFAFGENVPK